MILKKAAIALLAGICLLANGQNLIKDGDCNADPMSEEFGQGGAADQAKLSIFTEDLTWNRCLKFELTGFGKDKEGKHFVNTFVRLGGARGSFGFPCKPDTAYRFSVEIKGDAPRAMINYLQWSDAKDNWQGKTLNRTGIHLISPQKEWTRYQGTFRTGPKTKRAALSIHFWGSEASNDMPEKIGQYILIDKISVEEVKEGSVTAVAGNRSSGDRKDLLSGIVPAKVCLVSGTPAEISDFRDLKEDKPARLPTKGTIRRDSEGLHINLHFTGARPEVNPGVSLWANDVAELFFAPVKPDRRLSQFVISADGRRWMGNGSAEVKRNDEWKADVSVDADGWRVQAFIPFTLLGYEAAPPEGSFLPFNVGRQHIDPVPAPKKPDFSRGNRWAYGRMYDHSSWSFGYGEKEKFGILFFGSMTPYIEAELRKITSPELTEVKAAVSGAAPGLAWNQLKRLREEDRLLKLSKEPFIVAQIPPTTDPSIPFLPEALNHPQEKYMIRAAVNEHAPLVLALANMSDDFEEYRVTLTRGWERTEPQVEYWYRQPGLKSSDGTLFPNDQITIRRGVQGRDSDAAVHGKRFDILTRLNEVSSVPVPSRQGGLIWIDFDCHGMKPGVYKGTLTVTPLSSNRFLGYEHRPNGLKIRDTLTKEIPVELEILPIELSDADFPLNGFRTGFYQYHFDFMRHYSCGMFQIIPHFFAFEFEPDGSIRKEKLRSFLEPHIRLVAQNMKLVPSGMRKAMIFYGAYDKFKNLHCPKKQFPFDSPAYWNAWRSWCAAMDQILVRNGIPRSEYTIEIADEPHVKDFPKAELERACAELKKAVPGVHITVTNAEDVYADVLHPYVDSWIFSQYSVYDAKRGRQAAWFRSQPGKEWSVYCCDTSLRLDPYRYYRIHPWKNFDLKADFISIYQFYELQPGSDFHRVPAGGLAYDTAENLVPSIRLENLRIGMMDVRYMKLLERLAVGNSKAAQEARKFLAKAARDVVRIYPHDSSKADEMRAQAIKLILTLKEQKP